MNNSILLIEDNREVRENTAEILQLSNYSVYMAENGKAGLELAHKHKPDIILCDIMMPVLDGYGVLQAIENDPNLIGTPFVFITAKAEKDDFRKGMNLGADDYIIKPFSGDDLLRVVAARIRKNQLLKKTFTKTIEGINDFFKEAKSLHEFVNLSGELTRKKYRRKDIIYMEGDSPNHIYFVVSGKIKTFKTNYWGKEFITEIYKEGDFFGYMSLLEGRTEKESASAMEDSELALISKNDFLQLIYSNNEASLALVKLITNNLDKADEKLIKLAFDSARKKVAEALVFISKKYVSGGDGSPSFPIDRDNISAIAGISPETVSRNLTDLREEGLIETENGKIVIKDLKKLEAIK